MHATREAAMLRDHWSHHVLPQLSLVSSEIYNEKGSYMWELSYSPPNWAQNKAAHLFCLLQAASPRDVYAYTYKIGPEAGGDGGGENSNSGGGGGWCERGRWRFGLGRWRW